MSTVTLLLAAQAAGDNTFQVPLMPPQASAMAKQSDALFFGIFGLEMLIIVLVAVLVIVFAVRYRHGSKHEREYHVASKISDRIELSWGIPIFLIFIALYAWAGRLYVQMYTPPPKGDALQINGIAKQWMWKFEHPDGTREIDALHVPVGRKVNITVTSQDVVHSLYIPAFRVKRDVLPDRYVSLWFEPTKAGVYRLFCAEYCGTNHSRMRGLVHVLEQAEYERWLDGQEPVESPAAVGAALFRSYGCSACHDAGGTVHAPPLTGLYGRPVPLTGGGTRIADDAYIRDSILLPLKDVVASYPPVMPSFKGLISEADLYRLIAYVKSLAAVTRQPVQQSIPPEIFEKTRQPSKAQQSPAASDTSPNKRSPAQGNNSPNEGQTP